MTFEGRGLDRLRTAGGEVEFHNTGLYNLAGALSYPPPNTGIYEFTQKPEDIGKFKAPTLAKHRRHRAVHARRQRRNARGGD